MNSNQVLGASIGLTLVMKDLLIDMFGGAFRYKGAVNYYDLLPSSDNVLGYVYTVIYDGTSTEAGTNTINAEYSWGNLNNVNQWILIGHDMNSYVNAGFSQTFNATEKAQARTNIGAEESGAAAAAIATHNAAAASHPILRRPVNGVYEGVDLSTVFDDAAAFRAAVNTGDFSKIKVGDYWPISLTGSYRDVSSYTVPSGTTYYSDAALTTSAGTTSAAMEGVYESATAIKVTIGGTAYYVAIADCTAYFERSFSNAVIKMEVGSINPYFNMGDTGLGVNHVVLISRDCLPTPLKMRAANAVWHDETATNPWLGSALYETLNNAENGILPLVAATDIGAYIHAGPNGKGMRCLGETKAAGVASPTSWAWADRGKLFLPLESEIWGQSIWSDTGYCKGIVNQIEVFKGSLRHITKGLGNGGSRYYWWSASAQSGNAAFFAIVNYRGSPESSGAVYAFGVPVCFVLS